tara:strand:+ start:2006 stop:2440 length:435 start_codon:yes stop_codon:yes gene_type:complete
MELKIQVTKTSDAQIPQYAHDGDSGVDLFAAEEYELKPMERHLISTGLKIAIPQGYEAQVRPKSGLAINHGISVINTPGTIDSSYRGEVKVLMVNLGQESYKVEPGKKIAQMVFAKVEKAIFEESQDLNSTTRGEGGFGSTGLN